MTVTLIILLIAVSLVAIISLMTAYSLRKSLKSIETGIREFGNGLLDKRIKIDSQTGNLAESFNQMAKNLSDQLSAVTTERNELEAVFSGMSDGVLVTDNDQKILAINSAGAALLNVELRTSIGRSIVEIIYNPELQQFIRDVLEKKQTLERDIVIYKDVKRYLQVHGAFVDTAGGPRAVTVLNDMTRLHQLENLRQEFVSNVSHELKTPITSIKGFVETLLDGAINEPQKSKEFLEIIAKHTDRLNSIIEDILSLSRVELESENQGIVTQTDSIEKVLMSAAAACEMKAAEKQIRINIDCDPSLTAKINAPLLEQAIINLIDNAIKYSDQQKTITVTGRQNANEVRLNVEDQGCGIAQEHLTRIFERFYVTDRGRSRNWAEPVWAWP